MRPIRGGYLSFYNRKGLRGISFFVMAAPPFTVTVSGTSGAPFLSIITIWECFGQCGRAFIVICLIFNFFCRKSVFEEHFNCLERIFAMEQNSIAVSEIVSRCIVFVNK